MSHYKDFSAADFALDENFQKWVLSPDKQTIQFWENFIESYPEKRKVIDEAVQLVRMAGLSSVPEANAAYLEVWGNVNDHAERELSNRAKSTWPRYASLAAAIALVLISVTYLLRSSEKDIVEYKTSYAEIKEVVLNDGTEVMLNANSSLLLSDSWGTKNEREVFLEGEAFFNVVKTPDQKTFIVNLPDGVRIQVLGTTFNVNTRRESTSVYLQSGKVRLETPAESLTLKPGERADYKKSLQKTVINLESADFANDKLAWRNNLYIMNDLSLSTIARDIEDNFGKEVIIMDSALASRSVTAKVPARDMSVWLKVLSETLNLKIEQKNNQVIINPAIEE